MHVNASMQTIMISKSLSFFLGKKLLAESSRRICELPISGFVHKSHQFLQSSLCLHHPFIIRPFIWSTLYSHWGYSPCPIMTTMLGWGSLLITSLHLGRTSPLLDIRTGNRFLGLLFRFLFIFGLCFSFRGCLGLGLGFGSCFCPLFLNFLGFSTSFILSGKRRGHRYIYL